jgi:thioesterase domain-containing protein
MREQIEQDLLNSIPIVAKLGVQIQDYKDETISVSAPLSENFNYQGTAFGGSLNTIALLPCYLWANKICKPLGFKSLVIQDSSVQYLKPVTGNFIATADKPENVETFVKILKRRKSARITISSKIKRVDSDEVCVRFTGRFVATL